MSFGEGNLRERVRELEAERDWWRDELLEAYDEALPLYDRPGYGDATRPGVMVSAVLQGKDAGIAALEGENAKLRARVGLLEAQLAEGAQMHHRALGRGRELELLARGMAGLLHGICREGWTIDQARVSELLDAASGLGIDTETEES